VGLVCLSGCTASDKPLFTRLLPADTGITFINEITEHEGFNVLEYEYFYNGGGVAAGDVNGDSLPDLLFTANMGPNRLYLNRGAFTDRAADYGLDDPAYSTHAAFFDYDRDGDLDLYLLNHPIRRFNRFGVAFMRQQRDSLAGDKLYRNDGAHFTDVSAAAGIIGNPIGYGLSVSVSDLNGDDWPDIYIANDYVEDDYLYLNNGDGTFTESARQVLRQTSYSSMGADIADIDNDGRPDLFTLDKLPADPRRRKLLKGPDGDQRFEQLREQGFFPQYMRNMLQHNDGDGTFSEIGRLAGVSATDWSWAALFADFDNDGFKDLFVTNGYLRDYTDLDFLHGPLADAQRDIRLGKPPPSPLDLVRQMPSTPIANVAFRNQHDLTFSDETAAWGLDEPAFSNGAVYADLDADGDLDLVLNNINQPAFVYRNNARQTLPNHHYLKIRLEGAPGNRYGVGAKVTVTTAAGKTFFQEVMPARGYESSVEPVLNVGVGAATRVGIVVRWPDGRIERRDDARVDRTLTFHQTAAGPAHALPKASTAPLFREAPGRRGLDFAHRENAFDDFAHEPLLPHRLSRLGPALAHADVNRDGLEDLYFGGARGQAGALYLQQIDGTFRRVPVDVFTAHRVYEDVDALFFDADRDGDPDLYVVSGGIDAPPGGYQDRLYSNDGFGTFTDASDALPAMPTSGGAVAASDFDHDGDLDLFVGGRLVPDRYPLAPRSYLLENRNGQFVDITASVAPRLLAPGMVTAARWNDLDGDGNDELLLAGAWMPIRIFHREAGGAFTEISEKSGFARTNGWWNILSVTDLDGDGDLDLVAGNRGRNGSLDADADDPAAITAGDLDHNGTIDAVMSIPREGKRFPVPARDELLAQAPTLVKRFPSYTAYADATLGDLFTTGDVDTTLFVYTFETMLFENRGGGVFVPRPLPVEAQFAPVHGILSGDFDGDGITDLLMAGHDAGVRAQWGPADAGKGRSLRGNGSLSFTPVSATRSGFAARGEARRMAMIPGPGGPLFVIANNDGAPDVFTLGALLQPSRIPEP